MSILRWTSPERALRQVKRGRRVVTTRDFNQSVRDRYEAGLITWLGHIGKTGVTEPSCGCPVCQLARFNMEVK